MILRSKLSPWRRCALPAGIIGAAVVVSCAFALMRPPVFFPYSTALVAAGLTFTLALGLAMLLPDRLLYTDTQLISHAFGQRHRLSGPRADLALKAIHAAHEKALLLRDAGKAVHADLHRELSTAADRLDSIAGQLLEAPDTLRHVQALIIRSDLLVEAAATHKDLRKTASEETITQSRQKVLAGLAAFQESFAAIEKNTSERLLHRISAATNTAELLLGNRSR